MKKTIAFALVLLLLLVLAACGGGEDDSAPSSDVDSDAALPVQTGNGGTSSDLGQWPDNDFTQLVPKPSAGSVADTDTMGSTFLLAMEWTHEQASAYVQQLKEAGFDQNMSDLFVDSGSFTGENTNGDNVTVYFTAADDSVIQIAKNS